MNTEQSSLKSNKKILIILIIPVSLLIVGGWFILQDVYNINISELEITKLESGASIKYPFSIKIDGIELNIDVAETDEEKSKGLSGRTSLAKESGMLFIYKKPAYYSFWMKDMNFPIDIIWIGENLNIVDITYNAQPESYPQSFNPREPAQYIIEVNAGWVEEHRIHIGSPVILNGINIQNSIAKNTEEISEKNNLENIPISYDKTILAKNVLFDVPFTPQAVFGNWDDIRQSNACEEASAIMSMRWVEKRNLPLVQAEKEIIAISEFEKNKYGHFHDTSVKDTVIRIFNDYFKYNNVSVRYNIYTDDIKNELNNGNLVLVPVDGRKLGNPYYTQPGPPIHMLIIRGYDDATREFITNDPGTKRGEAYRYDYKVLENAIADYSSGHKEPGARTQTAMIIVRPR